MSGKIHDFPKTNSACQPKKMIYITERIYDLVGTERAAAAAKNCVIVRMAIIKPS